MLCYDNIFNYNKGDKFAPHWQGPYKVLEMFGNGSYQLVDISGQLHKTRVNGWQLKPYFSQIFDEQVELATTSLDNDEPLGLITQDPSLA